MESFVKIVFVIINVTHRWSINCIILPGLIIPIIPVLKICADIFSYKVARPLFIRLKTSIK